MSMQQVNLYLPELRPKQEWLTLNTITTAAVAILLLVGISSLTLSSKRERLLAQVEMLDSQIQASEDRLKKFKNMPRVAQGKVFDVKIRNLRKSISAREQIGQIIQGQSLGNETGFSDSMQALSRQYLRSISLQHIRISRGGRFVELKGLTRTVEDVPFYIKRLQDEASFADVHFGLLSVSEQIGGQNLHQFAFGFESVYQLASENNSP